MRRTRKTFSIIIYNEHQNLTAVKFVKIQTSTAVFNGKSQ